MKKAKILAAEKIHIRDTKMKNYKNVEQNRKINIQTAQ